LYNIILNSFQSVDVVTRIPSLIYSGFTEGANSLTSATYSVVFLIRPKKIVVPVSYRENIRVGRSEIKIFFEYFFMVFCWTIFSRVPTSILTRDANLGNLVQ
jgi:hypothetical protein